MELVRSNTQGELTALERGMHALRSGLSVRAYAEATGAKPGTVQNLMEAAKVAEGCSDVATGDLSRFTSHLSEIHAAPSWLWPALVARVVQEGEEMRVHTGRAR